MKILLLEDDVDTAKAVSDGLRREGHVPSVAVDVAGARRAIGETQFDAAILDVTLPDGSGYEVLETLHADCPETFALMLTARGTVQDRVEGLDRGADDYLVKPFAFAELAARLRALDRRPRPQPTIIRVGALEVDGERRVARCGETRLDLTPIEFGLLLMLLRLRGDVVSRGELLSEVWGYDFDPSTNVVDVHVNRLRRKLEAAGVVDLVRSVRGQGYAID